MTNNEDNQASQEPKEDIFDRALEIARGHAVAVEEEAIPTHARLAAENILKYGRGYAKYLEEAGDHALVEAEKYREFCYALAAQRRTEAEEEADRAIQYIKRIQRLGDTLQQELKNNPEKL